MYGAYNSSDESEYDQASMTDLNFPATDLLCGQPAATGFHGCARWDRRPAGKEVQLFAHSNACLITCMYPEIRSIQIRHRVTPWIRSRHKQHEHSMLIPIMMVEPILFASYLTT